MYVLPLRSIHFFDPTWTQPPVTAHHPPWCSAAQASEAAKRFDEQSAKLEARGVTGWFDGITGGFTGEYRKTHHKSHHIKSKVATRGSWCY